MPGATPKVIIVPSYEPDLSGPIIFLAGPIKNGPDWQKIAIHTLNLLQPGIIIANPRAPSPWHGDYDAQVDWEAHHINYACKHGVVLFWMSCETSHDCRRSYAQTTRAEWGRIYERYKYRDAQFVHGIEHGFSGRKYYQRTYERETPEIRIHHSLDETCNAAIELLKKG